MDELDQVRTLLVACRDAAAKGLQLLDRFAQGEVPIASSPIDADHVSRPVAWGARVSAVFVARVWWTAVSLGFDPDWLMACIAWESGETFSASVKNMAGSGATGLIQFMPTTAIGLGTTTAALALMTPEDQINYIYMYFHPWAGRIHTLADCYMAILLPSMVGQPDDAVLFSSGVTYRQNSGLDSNRDGKVTKLEAAAKVAQKLALGRQPGNMGVGR